ncbi:MAG: NADH-quinone oxidoreductase subunit [Bacilli bacterium]|nr:NADH-quinone oxidoreductase subunit [Bacilli bacterium]
MNFLGYLITGQFVAFFILALIVIASAILMLNFNKVMYMALAIGGVFVGVAGIFFLLNAEFIGIAQVLIYAGAITILMLFAIMLTHEKDGESNSKGWIHETASFVFVAILLAGLMYGIRTSTINWSPASDEPSAWPVGQNVEAVAASLFQTYTIPFEVVSVLLIVALVGAVVLARKEE